MDSSLLKTADDVILVILSFHAFSTLCAIRRTSKRLMAYTDEAFKRVRATIWIDRYEFATSLRRCDRLHTIKSTCDYRVLRNLRPLASAFRYMGRCDTSKLRRIEIPIDSMWLQRDRDLELDFAIIVSRWSTPKATQYRRIEYLVLVIPDLLCTNKLLLPFRDVDIRRLRLQVYGNLDLITDLHLLKRLEMLAFSNGFMGHTMHTVSDGARMLASQIARMPNLRVLDFSWCFPVSCLSAIRALRVLEPIIGQLDRLIMPPLHRTEPTSDLDDKLIEMSLIFEDCATPPEVIFFVAGEFNYADYVVLTELSIDKILSFVHNAVAGTYDECNKVPDFIMP